MPNFEKSPQVEPGEQQESKSNEPVFNPGEELKKVRETPKAQRLEQLATYKKNLAEQMAGMAKINEELESLVLNKSVSREELGIYLKERAQTYKLSPPQLEKYDLVLDKIEQQKKVIDFIDGRLAGRSEKEIFWIMFGFKPKGEVEIKKDSIEMVAYFKRTLEDAQVQLEKEGTVKAVVNKAKEDYAYAIDHQNTVEKL